MAKMMRLAGQSVSMKEFEGADWIADLIYFEGPLLSLFRGAKGHNDVLVLWVDCDDRRDRWVALNIERSDLKQYISQRISLRDLVEKQDSFLFFHTSGTARRSSCRRVGWDSFPNDYLPDTDTLWDKSLATEDALSLIEEEAGEYRILLDGENWYVDDLSKALSAYRQLYAFHYAICYRARNSVKGAVARTLSRLAWKGGFSTVNWFNALAALTPAIHRLRVKEIQYASPGHIGLDALPSVASDLASALFELSDSDNLENAQGIYRETYKFFEKHNLNRIDARNFTDLTDVERKTLEAEGVFDGISLRLDKFLSLYKMQYAKSDLLAAGAEELSLLKAMLSYHRRAVQLARYVEDGSLTIPTSDL